MRTEKRRNPTRHNAKPEPTRLDNVSFFIYREIARQTIDPEKPFLCNMPDHMLKHIDIFDDTLTDDIIIVAEALYEAYVTQHHKRPMDGVDRSRIPQVSRALHVYASLERLKRSAMIADYDILHGSPYSPETIIQVTGNNGEQHSATLAEYQGKLTPARKPRGRHKKRD